MTNFVTNIVYQTNWLTNTITNTITNEITPVEIVQTGWDWGLIIQVLVVIITLVTAGIMFLSVQEMKKENHIKYFIRITDNIERIVENFLDHRYSGEEYDKYIINKYVISNVYNFVIHLTKKTSEYKINTMELNKIYYQLKLMKNKKQLEYFEKIVSQIVKVERLLCDFTKCFGKNKLTYQQLTNIEKNKISSEEKYLLIYFIDLYHTLYKCFEIIILEEYTEINNLLESSSENIQLLRDIIDKEIENIKNGIPN